ncbi:DUF1516 family protein [Anaerobacillus sp. MEB173]|uniref:DUF1516 family protein n=1 Tax=Anaerobacillus sp. MEB173 TaxID=3383345 RepID=UPI003F91FC49
MPYAALLHTHVLTWFLALVFFIVSYFLFKAGKQKGQRITHMILRLMFILVFLSGGSLVFALGFSVSSIIKGVLAIWLLSLMELILVKSVKGKISGGYYWIQFIIALVAVFYYGYIVIPS